MGKAMLCFKSREQLEQYARAADFRRLTPNGLNGPDELYAEIERTRARGWAIDNEEGEEGLTCYAVALVDRSGAAIAAISCSGPSTRMERHTQRNLAALKKAAADISLAAKMQEPPAP